ELQVFIVECTGTQPINSAPLSSTTFKDFVAYWRREHAELNNEQKTRERDNQQLDSRIIPALGHYKLSELTTDILQRFINSLRKPGMRKDGKPGCLSDREVEMHRSLIHKILNKAVKTWQYLPVNPCSAVVGPRPKYKKVQIYDEPDMSKFLELVDTLPKAEFKYRLLTHLAFEVGLRRGELLALTWPEVDLDNGTLHVSHSLSYIVGIPLVLKDPKNERSDRYLYLPPEIVELLKEQRENQIAAFKKAEITWKPDGFVFTQRKSTNPMHVNSFNTWLKKVLPKAGLPETSIHKLRHAFGSYQIANGMDIATVKDAMGHSDLRTTSRYIHPLDSKKREVALNSASTMQRLRSIANQSTEGGNAAGTE
ncbi:MAG: tyrosine-type recombinase/integrase, partial [Veillonellales bacterium]